MKFGIIAAILIAFGAPLLVLMHIFSPSGIFELPSNSVIIPGIYFLFIGPPSALIVSIHGIDKDKDKNLAKLTMWLSIAWIVVVLLLWLIIFFPSAAIRVGILTL